MCVPACLAGSHVLADLITRELEGLEESMEKVETVKSRKPAEFSIVYK